MGTLLAFTMVACSVLILRYIPPDEVPLTPSHQETINSVLSRHRSTQKIDEENSKVCVGTSNEASQPLIAKVGASADPVILKGVAQGRCTCKSIICSLPCLDYFDTIPHWFHIRFGMVLNLDGFCHPSNRYFRLGSPIGLEALSYFLLFSIILNSKIVKFMF